MTINVIKIGGNVIDNPDALQSFLRDFNAVAGSKILIHGGGKIATRMAAELGIETVMVEGRRVTSPAMLDVAVMVYAGLINKRIVATLQSIGCNAIGMCGADGGCIESQRRPVTTVDYGEVGDVVRVNADTLLSLIDAGFTPVVCAITADADGNLLNTNADTVATEIAKALSHDRTTNLIFCFEKPGVLAVIDNDASVIDEITPDNVTELKENGTISGGMLPKVENALSAITDSEINEVIIKSSNHLCDAGGTRISR